MEELKAKLAEFGMNAGGKLVLALVVFIVGSLVIKAVRKAMDRADKISRMEKTVRSFVKNLAVAVMYVVLVICIIEILGIPMTSVVAVLASCGLAVGLALQGALTNLAGGLMILIFKPFKIGDYVENGDAEGFVRDISIFYTTLTTWDNKRITIPNGDLMNSNVTNYSCEDLRRIDLDFKLTNDCDENYAKGVLLEAVENTEGILRDPEPFARLSAVDDDTYIFTVRGWVESAKYWDIYYNLLENCSLALSEHGIDDPEERIAVRLVKSEDEEEEEEN